MTFFWLKSRESFSVFFWLCMSLEKGIVMKSKAFKFVFSTV